MILIIFLLIKVTYCSCTGSKISSEGVTLYPSMTPAGPEFSRYKYCVEWYVYAVFYYILIYKKVDYV